MGVRSYHIERPEDIQPRGWRRPARSGLPPGASTPDDVIQDVVDSLIAKGYTPPEGGIRPIDPDYVPAY